MDGQIVIQDWKKKAWTALCVLCNLEFKIELQSFENFFENF